MNRLLFVSNTSLTSPKGGWDGLGSQILNLFLGFNFDIKILENLNPKISRLELLKSRLQKVFHIPRIFPSFSERRLSRIARQFEQTIKQYDSDQILFHGSTPWIAIQTEIKYSAILDCCFSTYLKSYLRYERFTIKSIDLIKAGERRFLEKADTVFFTSNWALDETKTEYNIDGKNFIYLGQGPSFNIPEIKVNMSIIKNQFIFVATDFVGKGGPIVFEAFIEFLKSRKDYHLVIIGQKPTNDILSHPNVKYLGFIDKSSERGRSQFMNLYSESKANILLTNRDILPLVIIESGLCGCPTVATSFNAIPELIKQKETGWLIDQNASALTETMKEIASLDDTALFEIRNSVIAKMKTDSSWEKIKDTLYNRIKNN